MTTKDLRYPVASVDIYGNVDISVDEKTLTTFTSVALKARRWIGCYIVDCEGRAAKIEDMCFVSGIGSFWGYTVFFNRLIRVDITFGEEYVVSLDEIKKHILKYIYGGKDSIISPSKMVGDMRIIKAADTYEELFKLALPYMDIREFWQLTKKH